MKKIALILTLVLFVTAFTSCKRKQDNEPTTDTVINSDVTENYNTEPYTQANADNSVSKTESKPVTQTQKNTAPATTQPEAKKVVTYISENPDNTYICMVSAKYGSDKANLIAFIKTNSDFPGATVLEFSGERDANGNLITTADTLKYVYDVADSGSIKRASSDGLNNDGYNSITAKAAIMLGEKFFIPSIPEMREHRRYEDYF